MAAVIGSAMLATTPVSANAVPFKSPPVVSQQNDLVTEVRRRGNRRRGHRGYRRRGRGAGVAAGILGGLIIGGIIADSERRRYRRRVIRRDDAHINWCYYRYRSYRAYDNTFQPYHGRRRQCVSPYY